RCLLRLRTTWLKLHLHKRTIGVAGQSFSLAASLFSIDVGHSVSQQRGSYRAPNSPLHLSNRAHALLLLNRPQASLADADHAVRVRPDWGKGHYQRGLALSALMRNEEALLALCTSAVIDKNPQAVRHELTRVLHRVLAVNVRRQSGASFRTPYDLVEVRMRRNRHHLLLPLISSGHRNHRRSPNGGGGGNALNTSDCEDNSSGGEEEFSQSFCRRLLSSTTPQDNLKLYATLDRLYQEVEKLKRVEAKPAEILLPPPNGGAAGGDLDCILCCRLLYKPVTTPCGHTYCWMCLDRCLDYSSACPLCVTSLADYLASSQKTVTEFVERALKIAAPKEYAARAASHRHELVQNDAAEETAANESERIAVFVCTTAFPCVACPLFVYEPRYRLMVRRCLDSGVRQFGIAACLNREATGAKRYAEYGTMLEIRDRVLLKDGCSILSTVGARRFRVLSGGERDGYDTAQVEFLRDTPIPADQLLNVAELHNKVRAKSRRWWVTVPASQRSEIRRVFGEMPEPEDDWLRLPDGPSWTWWLLAILPLGPQLQVGILGTTSLEKRLRAIEKTLDHMEQRHLSVGPAASEETTQSSSICRDASGRGTMMDDEEAGSRTSGSARTAAVSVVQHTKPAKLAILIESNRLCIASVSVSAKSSSAYERIKSRTTKFLRYSCTFIHLIEYLEPTETRDIISNMQSIMNGNATYFEKYVVAPCPSRDYYGVKVFQNIVTLCLWKVSYGPHLSPVIREIKFSDFNEDKLLKDEIGHIFGPAVLGYLEQVTSKGVNTLLTLPRVVIEKLVRYLDLTDISKLLCTSRISSEIFNTNSIWEILYKSSKEIPELSEMEKDLGASRGFLKLTKDHHLCNVSKKNLKEIDEKLLYAKKMERNDTILRSASVSIPKTTMRRNDDKSSSNKKYSIESNSKQVRKSLKSSIKDFSKSKRLDLPAQPPIFIDRRNFSEKQGADEGYQNTKFIDQAVAEAKIERKDNELAKFQFVNEDDDKTELVLQKNYLKSAIVHSNLSDIDLQDATNKKYGVPKSHRSILTKQSCYNEERDKTPEPRTSKSSKKKLSKAGGASNLKTLTSSAKKTDDLEESGMSYLMKKYLAASDEVARKFSECESLAQSTKNSGIQVDMKEKSERKLLKCAAPAAKQAQSRSGCDGANISTKLQRSLKKS
ncbi:hypothetical protein TSAR_002244, partial [Trichomalopsis sarcophagae]